ncbi:MAG TPA: YraN family protein [Pirellulales bacterium]
MAARWFKRLAARLWPVQPRTLGKRGEAAAARYLRHLGYKIVARGDRQPIGELDLVAVDSRTVVFVEVKTRTSRQAGEPSEAVDAEKQRRLTRTALMFLKRHGLLDNPARFDVVAVTWSDAAGEPEIEHVRDAFPATGLRGMYS